MGISGDQGAQGAQGDNGTSNLKQSLLFFENVTLNQTNSQPAVSDLSYSSVKTFYNGVEEFVNTYQLRAESGRSYDLANVKLSVRVTGT